MRKKFAIIASVMILAMATGCGNEEKSEKTTATTEAVTEAETTTEELVGGDQIANPWRDITEDEAAVTVPRLFTSPEGAQNVKWSVMEDGNKQPPMAQLVFTLDETEYTARAQVGTEEEDISGMYYEWTSTEEITLSNWGKGNQKATAYSFVENDAVRVMVVTWFDSEPGVNYSLSTVGDDLNGLDLAAIADQIYKDRDASAGSIKVEGSDETDGQNPVMNIIGTYGCDRATMTIEAQGSDEAKISITWPNSAAEYAEWNMVGKFDTATNTVNYTNCEKKTVTFSEEGEIDKETTDYTDGTGSIKVNDDYSLEWIDDKEHIADGSKFVFSN